MVIHSSALMAILLDEPEAPHGLDRISRDGPRHIRTATLLESPMVALPIPGNEGLRELRVLLQLGRIDPIPLTPDHAASALQGWRCFGKGRHQAGLNLGEGFSDGLAKAMNTPLLYKGNSFTPTDVLSVAPHS
jgi:ribonuclease VapC